MVSLGTVQSLHAKSGDLELLDRIAAIVNDDVITVNGLERQVERVRQQIRQQQTIAPPVNVLRRQVLEREISKHLQLQFARNTGIFVDDNALNSTIENIAAQNKMDIREFRQVLESDGVAFDQFREDVRDEMIIARLQQREVVSRILVTEQEVESFIATQQVQGASDSEFHISHILIALPEAASPEVIEKKRKQAGEILKNLRKGADFAQTAISSSDGQQALKGGDLGWRRSGQLPTLFSRLLPQMKSGDISDLIRSPSGFHIIKLNEMRRGEQHIVTQTLSRHILIKPSALITETEAISRLRNLRNRILDGDSFEELARSHSEDRVSASDGGSLGWSNPGTMVPQFEAVVDQLKKNQISEPFQSAFGWHIVQLLDRRELDNSEEYQRNQARDFIRERKTEENRDTWLRQLRSEAFVEIKIEDRL
ncbi:MAG: peptidylprolyl isomerase [Gammaproteobacteria bacterium]|nr:peptidylprolyl isomerase [Gammaproteobacteria bacterium]